MADSFSRKIERFGLGLPAATITRLELFLDELLRWNRRVNLTSICNRDEALEKHLLDSLALLHYQPLVGRLLDMGSGGGLPGIPLAIACSDLQVTSVDSVGKKINFQKHIKRLLSLSNLEPVHARLEALEAVLLNLESYDFAVARALTSFEKLTVFAAPWLREGGKLLVMKGPEGETELKAYQTDSDRKFYHIDTVHHYRLPLSNSARQLIILSRTASK
ncbi:MAG: 16S rRNA (guanine(527)-N(7))-methyltransferase RsmG [Deltaproteobacteria bacterium]|nr:16S rRNA (guanine(527)-N(7))-methyltransferase RsmG [Deltaproteobacteria bacterium]